MRRGNRSQASNTGLVSLLLMLGNQVRRMDQKPPVTIALVAVQVLLFAAPADIVNLIPPISKACLHPYKVLQQLELSRIFWSAFLHADETHIFYNMSSLLWKGAQLEPQLGSTKFALVVLELLVSSQVIMVMLARACVTFAPAFAAQYYSTCAVGFSAVLFALKVVLNSNSPGWSSVAGISLPTKYVTWAELIYIQLLTPNASFLGHLAGILAGMLHLAVLQHLPMLRSGPTPFTGQGRYAHAPNADPDATAAGGLNTPGPRRSARFANQQKPSSGSNAAGQQQSATPRGRQSGSSQRGQPDCNHAQAQLQRSWLQTFIWIAWAMLAVLVAVMAATNPSRAAFWDSISQLTTRGLGQWAGGMVGSMFGLQSTSNTALSINNFFLLSFAVYHGYYFLGIFGQWIPLEPRLFAFWLIAHSSWTWRIAKQFLGRDFGFLQWVQQNLQNPGWLWTTAQRFMQQQL